MKRTVIIITFILFLTIVSYSGIIDNFSYINNWQADPNNRPDIISIKTEKHDERDSLVINYDFTDRTNGWMAVKRDCSFKDLTPGDALKFVYKASGQDTQLQTLQIKLEDADGTVYGANIPDCFPQKTWKTMTVKYQGTGNVFQYFWTSDTGDQYLNLKRIKNISIGMTAALGTGGQGSIWLDNLSIFQTTGISPQKYIIDDFNDGDLVNNDGNNWLETGDGETAYTIDTSIKYAGNSSLKLKYDASTNWTVVYSDINNIDASAYQCISFYAKSSENNAQFSLKLNCSDQVIVWPVGNITKNWQFFQIDLNSMADRESRLASIFTNIKRIELAFETNHTPRKGTIWLDELKFKSYYNYPAGEIMEIENFDDFYSLKAISVAVHNEDPIRIRWVDGFDGKTFRADYEFRNGEYYVFTLPLALNFFRDNLKTFQFYYKGKGANNLFDIKFYDPDNKVFHKTFYAITDTKDEWQKMQFDIKDLEPFSSGGEHLNFKLYNIQRIEFALNDYDFNQKTGQFVISDLRILPSTLLNEQFPDNDILADIRFNRLPYNPLIEELIITFTLKKTARVEIFIFDTAGNMVYDFTEKSLLQDLGEGEHQISWDGQTRYNKVINNGLYFFQIIAYADDKKEHFEEVLPIIKHDWQLLNK